MGYTEDMKKFMLFFGAGVAGGLMVVPLAVGAFSYERDLYLGIRNSDVEQLQNFLKDQGDYTGPVTGYFGVLTRAGVKKFQENNNIVPAVGYFGPKTRSVANARVVSAAAPAEGGSQIADIQKKLQDLQNQLSAVQAASATPPAVSPAPAPAPIVAPLPNPFESSMAIVSNYPSLTLSSYTNITLNEFQLSSVPEKVAITRFRLTNDGTLSDIYFSGIDLVNSATREVLATVDAPTDKIIEFTMAPNSAKQDKGVMVSGGTYAIVATLRTPNNNGTKPNIRLNLQSASDITAVDYATLARAAVISKANSFPILGPYITTF